MAERSFFEFLQASLEHVRRESPAAYARMGGAMGAGAIRLRVDGAVRSLRWSRAEVILGDAAEAACACELTTGRATIEALVEGRVDLLDALLDDALELRGAPPAVIEAYEVLMAFLQGAIRSPSLPALLDDYLGSDTTEGTWPRNHRKL